MKSRKFLLIVIILIFGLMLQFVNATDMPYGYTSDEVKCVFANSDVEQRCYSENGQFGCSGIGTCVALFYGEKGSKITWKSSCGGHAYTVIDGKRDYAEFACVKETKCPKIVTPNCVNPVPRYDDIGCVSSYECCPQISRPDCPRASSTHDSKGCVIDYKCEPCTDISVYDNTSLCYENSRLSWKVGHTGCLIPHCVEKESGEKYRYATWMCMDSKEFKKGNIFTCKSRDEWYDIAEDSCSGRSAGDVMGGVLNFNFSDICYSCPQVSPPTSDVCPNDKIKPKYDDIGCITKFECLSNACPDEKCVNKKFIQKVMDWFKNLFG